MTLLGWLGLAFLLRRRDPQEPNPSPAGFGYTETLITFVVLTLISLPFAVCLLAWHGWGLALAAIWYSVLILIVTAMLAAVHRGAVRISRPFNSKAPVGPLRALEMVGWGSVSYWLRWPSESLSGPL